MTGDVGGRFPLPPGGKGQPGLELACPQVRLAGSAKSKIVLMPGWLVPGRQEQVEGKGQAPRVAPDRSGPAPGLELAWGPSRASHCFCHLKIS